jgi:hypothetical protein
MRSLEIEAGRDKPSIAASRTSETVAHPGLATPDASGAHAGQGL